MLDYKTPISTYKKLVYRLCSITKINLLILTKVKQTFTQLFLASLRLIHTYEQLTMHLLIFLQEQR